MGNNERYVAFISYRHCMPDSEIAARLHKNLETYRLPKEVAKKIGKSRIDRVFRDDAELSVADDLSEEIDKALRHSDYLIVICSPDYLESEWCRKELEFFLKHNDRSHVLLVLANGEPETAFPSVLVSPGTEPLAADCRADNAKDRKNHVDTATIRLAAAMCGVGYDDLVQRHRKEKQMRNIRRTLMAFFVMLTILLITVYFLVRISKQNVIITQRYADALAGTSTALLMDGRRLDAIYAARLGLPNQRTYAYSESATTALVKALGIYDVPGYGCDDDIILPFSTSYFFVVSPNGKYLGMCGLNNESYVMDLETGDISPISDTSMVKNGFFDGERGFVYSRNDGNFCFFDLSDSTVTDLGVSMTEIFVDERGAGYAFDEAGTLYFYRGSECLCSFSYLDRIHNIGELFRTQVFYSDDGSHAYVYSGSYEENISYFFAVDLETGVVNDVDLSANAHYYAITASDGNSLLASFTEDEDDYLILQDIGSSEVKWSKILLRNLAGIGMLGDDVVACTSNDIYIFDRELNFKKRITTDGELTGLVVSNDGIIIYEMNNGIHLIKDGEYERIKPQTVSNKYKEQLFRCGTLYLVSSGENCITTYRERSSEYLTPYDGNYTPTKTYEYESPEITELIDSILDHDDDYDESRIYDAMPCENADLALIQLWDGVIYIYDTNTYERIKTIYTIYGMVSNFYYDEAHELYYIGADTMEVYDKDFKNIYEIPDCHFFGFAETTGLPVVSYWEDEDEYIYMVQPLSYEEIIQIADEQLENYVLDERIKEKYALE